MLDDFANAHCDFLAALDNVLQKSSTDDMAEGGLRTLDEGLADVGDGEGGPVRLVNVVVNYGGTLLFSGQPALQPCV